MKKIPALLGSLQGLQSRMMLTMVVGAVLFAVLGGALAYRMGHQRALGNGRGTLESLARTVEKTLAIGVFARDDVLMQEVVDGLAGNQLVAAVEVRSPTGAVLARNRRINASGRSNRDVAVDRNLVSPFDPQETIGVLHLRAEDSRIDAIASADARLLAALTAVQTALVALLLYGVGAWLVSRPIVRLARQLAELPAGTDRRLATPGLHRRDEIGVLIAGANALLDANALAFERERGLHAEVEQLEARYREIFEASSAGIFVLDPSGHLVNANSTVARLVGLSRERLLELRHGNFIQRVFDRPEQVLVMIHRATRVGKTVFADLELVQHGATRGWVHCLISVPAKADMVEGVMYDITERRSTETAVLFRSEHDALTGLMNRSRSEAAVDRFIRDAIECGAPMSLLCIDLDGFKQVNDQFGHEAGDQVLVASALRMQAAVRRTSDLVGRLGGDEFLVVLRDVGPDDPSLSTVSAALLDALCAPVELEGGIRVRIGASIGIACLPRHGVDRISLSRAADAVMYEVKRSGKNSFAMAIGAVSPRETADTARRSGGAQRYPTSRSDPHSSQKSQKSQKSEEDQEDQD